MSDRQKIIGKLLVEKTGTAMMAVAERYGLLTEGRIDLRGGKIRFNHAGLDLRLFLLDGCDLSGSRLENCTGEGVSFQGCIFNNVQLTSEKGTKVSFRGAAFDDARWNDATMVWW